MNRLFAFMARPDWCSPLAGALMAVESPKKRASRAEPEGRPGGSGGPIVDMNRARSVALAAVLLACAPAAAEDAGERGTGRPAGEPVSGGVVPLRIAAAGGVVALRVEIAATGASRLRGLMDRPHLPADAGMLFVYPGPRPGDAGFWMYRTRIPLDVAFLDADGRILAIQGMEPCASPLALRCPAYAPGVPYHAALEANRGFFARNGIAVGDRVLAPPGVSFGRSAE